MPTAPSIRGLYLITPVIPSLRQVMQDLDAVLEAGVAVLQYRRKPFADDREAAAVLELCRSRGVVFIVNDDPHLARRLAADGVHIGKHDAAISEARAILGPERIIGVSCYNELERGIRACAAGADYVAFGRFFPSSTKPDAVPAPLELLAAARALISQPIVAIGGITPDNVRQLLSNGADCVAVSAGVFEAADPVAQTKKFITELAGVSRTG